VVAQVAFGLAAHSLALVADAGHNFADVLGLVLAWWRAGWSRPTDEGTEPTHGERVNPRGARNACFSVTMGAVAWEPSSGLKSRKRGWAGGYLGCGAGIVVNE